MTDGDIAKLSLQIVPLLHSTELVEYLILINTTSCHVSL